MLRKEEASSLIKKFGANEKDSGSAAVQIALLTTRIQNLAPHFEKNKHDFHSKVGLMKLIGRRRRLLRYLAKQNKDQYESVLKELNLRK